MSLKYKIIGSLVALVIAFAFGRYSAPVSVKTDTKVADTENDKKKSDDNTDTHKHITTVDVVTKKPDGTVIDKKTTTEDDDTKKHDVTTVDDTKTHNQEISKDVEKERSKLTISALAGTKISFSNPLQPVYGGMVQKEILGPISIGGWGLSNGIVGGALGISF